MNNLQELQRVLILLLLFIVGFGALANRLKRPYPILMVIGGLILSLLPGVPSISLQPNVIFLIVLPPLLYAAAFNTSWRDFRYNLVSIGLLAFGLVAFTVIGVAMISRWILPGFDWRLGLVLGAVVSPTDAIAATAIARRVGLPRRIIDVLEGESLLNDASGLLALEYAVAIVVARGVPSAMQAEGRLVYLVAGGIVTGLIVGKIIVWLERHIDDAPIEVTLSIVTPYIAYLSAEAIHASGVMAAVTCGLYLGRRSATFFSSPVRIEANAFWNTFIFILNGAVFVLIGFQLPFIHAGLHNFSLRDLILQGILFSGAVILLRMMWVVPGTHLAYFIRRKFLGHRESTPAGRSIFVVGWTGMRGVVSLAAAISLPAYVATGAPFPKRDLIIFLTFCVIFVTLVLQGLTLPWLIRRLRLAETSMEKCEEKEARRIMTAAVLKRLDESPERTKPELQAVYEDVTAHYQTRLEALEESLDRADAGLFGQHDLFERLAAEMRRTEREAAILLRDQERISDEALRSLLRELDLLDAGGPP